MSERFGPMLEGFRVRARLSRNRLAVIVGVDASYVQRIITEQRNPPRRHIIEALATALHLTPFERNGLLVAAGFTPLVRTEVGTVAEVGWGPTLQAVADVLNAPHLSAEEKQAYRGMIEEVARLYLAQAGRNARNGH